MNLGKINGEFKENELVQEVTKFIERIKKDLFAHLYLNNDWLNIWRNILSKGSSKKLKRKLKYLIDLTKSRAFKRDRHTYGINRTIW